MLRGAHHIMDMGLVHPWYGISSQIHAKFVSEGLYVLAVNDVIRYFRSAANRINVLILGHVLVEISR